MPSIELRSTLDEHVLSDVLGLIDAAAEIEGHRPVGEHKLSHLRIGARGWAGVLARSGGRLVGYAHTRWNAPGADPRMAVEVVVHPEWYSSDVARRLLEETRAMLGRAGGGRLHVWVHRVDDPEETLAAQMGFRVERVLQFMQRDLDEPPPEPATPEGIDLRTFRDADTAAFLEVNNAAFEGHPENGGWSEADFEERRALEWFDPAGLFLAWRGDELLGFHWTKVHSHELEEVPAHDPVGEVYVLGISPAAQGLGLGGYLLDVGLRHLYDAKCRTAVLYVDRANTTAVRLYERSGFTTLYSEVCYADDVWATVEATDFRRPA